MIVQSGKPASHCTCYVVWFYQLCLCSNDLQEVTLLCHIIVNSSSNRQQARGNDSSYPFTIDHLTKHNKLSKLISLGSPNPHPNQLHNVTINLPLHRISLLSSLESLSIAPFSSTFSHFLLAMQSSMARAFHACSPTFQVPCPLLLCANSYWLFLEILPRETIFVSEPILSGCCLKGSLETALSSFWTYPSTITCLS